MKKRRAAKGPKLSDGSSIYASNPGPRVHTVFGKELALHRPWGLRREGSMTGNPPVDARKLILAIAQHYDIDQKTAKMLFRHFWSEVARLLAEDQEAVWIPGVGSIVPRWRNRAAYHDIQTRKTFPFSGGGYIVIRFQVSAYLRKRVQEANARRTKQQG